MLAKQVLVFILCFNLAFPTYGWGAPVTVNPIAELLAQHRNIKIGVGSMELVNKHGKALADETFKIMSDPKFKNILSTPEGIELRKHQKLLTNYLAVKNHLEKCVKDHSAKRNLKDRVLQSTFQTILNPNEASVPCAVEANKVNTNFLDFNNTVAKAMKKIVKPYFQNELSKQVISNTARSLLGFKVKFTPGFMSKGYLTQPELNTIIDKVCLKRAPVNPYGNPAEDVCSKMDKGFIPKLSQSLIDFSKTLRPKEKLSPEAATQSLNAAIDRINGSLSKIKVKKDSGYIYDSVNLKDKDTKAEFDQYINQYMSEVSKDAGVLLLSSKIKAEAGEIKSFSSSDVTKNKTKQFKFDHHNKIKLADVKASIVEVESKMLNQATDAMKIVSDATKKKDLLTSDEDDIAELVKINPLAAGQVLSRSPEYAGIMCDTINKIHEDDKFDANLDKYFFVGSAIIGGALFLTGIGTPVVAYLLTGAVTTVAGSTGAAVLSYVAVLGAANEMASLSYQGKRAYDNAQEINRLETSYLTQNSDSEAVTLAKDALLEFKEARLLAGISFVSLGMNVVNASKLFNIFQTTSKVSTDEVKAATKILQYISQTAVGKRLKDVAKVMGEKSMEKIDLFMFNLAKTSEVNRVKFLELLSDTKVLPEKIKDIINASLDAVKNCEKV
jgi:ribosomal protein S15P/S13E